MAWQGPHDDDIEGLFGPDAQSSTAPAVPNKHNTSFASSPNTWDQPPSSSQPTSATHRQPAPPPAATIASLPVRQQRAAARGAAAGAQGAQNLRYEERTVDESDWKSLTRELTSIWRNLKLVCNPLLRQDDVEAMLQHWDLWGPLIFTLLLASLLSLESADTEIVFCVIFVVIILGALLLTANVVLLGGSVSFFQSISLLGYCMFPMDVSAIICVFVKNTWVRLVVIALGMAWAMRASVPFVAGSVGDKRRFLAVFPIALMYTVLGWFSFISG